MNNRTARPLCECVTSEEGNRVWELASSVDAFRSHVQGMEPSRLQEKTVYAMSEILHALTGDRSYQSNRVLWCIDEDDWESYWYAGPTDVTADFIIAHHAELHGYDVAEYVEELLPAVSRVAPDSPVAIEDIDGVTHWATAAEWASKFASDSLQPVEFPIPQPQAN